MKTYNVIQVLKSPYLIFRHSIFYRYINKVCSFFMMAVIPQLKRRQVEKYYLSSETLKVFTQDQVYKVGLCYGDLQCELNNIRVIEERFPELTHYLLPQKTHKIFIFLITQSKRCHFNTQRTRMLSAIKILELLKQYSHVRQLILNEFSTIRQGLKLLRILFPNYPFSYEMGKILSRKWRVGPTHGDFHLENILCDENRQTYLIDLDNFSCTGIQALDAFTLWVDYCKRQTRLTWQKIIQKGMKQIIDDEVSMSIRKYFDNEFHLIAFLYVVHRMGYENRYYKLLSKSVLNEYKIILEISKIIMEYEHGS